MKSKLLATLSPLCLCLVVGRATAALEPFSAGASESIAHDSNIYRNDSRPISDWYSTTELRGGINQALGRDQLIGSAAVNYANYQRSIDKSLNSFGYTGALRLDWSTIGDLSGSLGADASRRRHDYGFEDASVGDKRGRDLESDSHTFAKFLLGGQSRWSVFAGFDANRRRFSSTAYSVNDEQQWGGNAGTTYSTSPDLSFGITGSYTRGEYPNYDLPSNFNSKNLSATTNWHASGNSTLNASVGYSTQESQLQPVLHYVSGSLHWNWAPPSRFQVILGLSRSTDGGVASAGAPSSLNDRSLNTTGSLDVTYELTSKVSLAAGAQYAHRNYSNVEVPVLDDHGVPIPQDFTVVSGTNHTSRISFAAHYRPTRTTDLSCSAQHEVRGSGSVTLAKITSNYVDNLLQCVGSISFN